MDSTEVTTAALPPVEATSPDPRYIGSRPDYRGAATEQPGVPLSETRPLNPAEIQELSTLETGDLIAAQVNLWLRAGTGWHNGIADPNNPTKRDRRHEEFANLLKQASDNIETGHPSEAAFFLLNLARLRYSGQESALKSTPSTTFYDESTNPLYLPDYTSPDQVLDSADRLVKAAAVLAKSIEPDIPHTI